MRYYFSSTINRDQKKRRWNRINRIAPFLARFATLLIGSLLKGNNQKRAYPVRLESKRVYPGIKSKYTPRATRTNRAVRDKDPGTPVKCGYYQLVIMLWFSTAFRCYICLTICQYVVQIVLYCCFGRSLLLFFCLFLPLQFFTAIIFSLYSTIMLTLPQP